MTGRAALRAAAVTALAVAAFALTALPALAAKRDDGDEPGPKLDALSALLLYVGVPLAAFVVISAVVWAMSSGGQRYRPGVGSWAGTEWFGGPGEPDRALGAATPTTEGGGARARW
jgi:hypothetical protein